MISSIRSNRQLQQKTLVSQPPALEMKRNQGVINYRKLIALDGAQILEEIQTITTLWQLTLVRINNRITNKEYLMKKQLVQN